MAYRLRKLLGAVILLIFVPFYALYAMALAASILPGTGPWTQLGYYVVAGLAWILPAGLVVTWMFRPPKARVTG